MTSPLVRIPRSVEDAPIGSVDASPGSSQPGRLPSRLGHPAIRRWAAPLGVGMLALVISLVGIGVPSLWYDEVATVTSATRSWPQLADMITVVDAVHALYYALMHVVFDVFGYSPVSLRVPSAVATALAAALTVVLGRQLGGHRLGLVAGLVFCLLPRTIWMGAEGRSYAFTALAAVLLTIVLVHAIRSPRRRWWVVYAALIVLSCALFIYLALIVAAHAVSMLWWAARRNAPDDVRRSARRWTLATTVATLVVIPFALQVMGQSRQLHWLKPLGDYTLEQVVRGQWFTGSWNYTGTWTYAGAGWALLVIGVLLVLRPGRTGAPRSDVGLGVVLIPAFCVPTLLLLATTAVYLPIYTPRYLTMSLPFVALLMAIALARLPGRLAPAIALVALGALAVPQIIDQRQPMAKESSSWSQVADFMASERAEAGPDSTTAIIYGGVQFHPTATARVIAYSYPDAFAGTIDVTLATPAAETGQLWETRSPLSNSIDRLDDADVAYLITSVARDQRAATTNTMGAIGWEVTDSWDFSKVHVLKYECE